MMNSNVFLVNLPSKITRNLLPILESERLGNVQSIESDDITLPADTYLTNTDFVIFYSNVIDEDNIAKLELKEDIPTLLITSDLSFEMVRTAKEYHINAVLDEADSELISLIYGFIRQHDIYRFQHALIVDDSRVDSRIVSNLLSQEFIHNEIELSANKVIERLISAPTINIIILDFEMPYKNGCELMDEIKGTFSERSFIFIGLTGSRNGAIKFLTHGANDVFIKPLDHDIFTLKLKRMIFNAHKVNKESRTLNDYKKIIKRITKEIYNPIYVLTTVNDCLLDKQTSTDTYNSLKKLSIGCKEKLTDTFNDLLSYFAVSSYMKSSLVKSCSLQSMIATQLYLESSEEKLRNIVVNKSLDADIKSLCVPEQIGQVINQLTHNAVMRSQNGGELNIRLYTKNNDIVFEVEDAPSIDLDRKSANASMSMNCSNKNLDEQQPLNQLLCEKIINQYDGSLGYSPKDTGDIHFFKIPKKSFSLGKECY